ncbi:MAG: hypothetical protein AABX70_05495 [Nanoarchaeota archaeon]
MKNSIEEYNQAKFNIIRKLYTKKKFSKGHLLYERLEKTLPSHLRGLAKKVLKDLVKEGLVVWYGRTEHGDAFQLNKGRLRDVEEILAAREKVNDYSSYEL